MKKTLLIAACGLFAATTYAQQKQTVSAKQNKFIQARTITNTDSADDAQTTETRWVNWGETIETFHEDEPSFVWSATMLEDSSAFSTFDDGTTGSPFIHAAAVTIVPSDPNWGWLSPYNDATATSVRILGWYERGTNVADDVVDQLKFDIIRNISSTASTVNAAGETTGVFVNLAYDQATNAPAPADVLATYTMDLTVDDHTGADESNYFTMAIDPVAIAATNDPDPAEGTVGNNISVVVTYISGSAHDLDSEIGVDLSSFAFGSLEEFGQGTSPDDYLTYNSSFIISSDIRYNLSDADNGNWNGSYIPSIAYNQPGWSLENHLIDVELTSDGVTIDESNQVEFNVYPNPSTGLVKVVTNNSGFEQSIDVKNILGQEVMNVVSTNENEDLDMTSFEKGVYFLTVTNGDSQVTKKVVIQ